MSRYYTLETNNPFGNLSDSGSGAEDILSNEQLRARQVQEADKPEKAPRESRVRPPRSSPKDAGRSPRRAPAHEADPEAQEPEENKPVRRGGPRTRPPRRGGRGGPEVRTGGRVFERHSGTGRGNEVARQGAGAHNWGDVHDERGLAAEATLEGDEEAGVTAVEEATPVSEVEEKPVEPKAITLTQYLKEVDVSSLPAKKLVEAVPENYSKDGYVLKQLSPASPETSNADSTTAAQGQVGHKAVDLSSMVGLKTAPPRRREPPRDRPPREGAREPREPREPKEAREGEKTKPKKRRQPNLEDESAFPQLA